MPQPTALSVRNPYSGATLAELAFATPAESAQALARARATFEKWRRASAHDRAQLLNGVATALDARKTEFAELIRDEAGKPIAFAAIEVERAVGVLRWAASEAQRQAGEALRLDAGPGGRAGFGIAGRFPRGVILGITPFNFPLNLAIHKIAPAVAAGCSILVKPSPATPLTALRLAELFEERVPGLVQVTLADDAGTAALTRAPEVAMISFTGSARVGYEIRRQAPEKPATLELGGNAWAIVLEDAPEAAIPAIVKRITGAAFGYAGQSCISVQNVAVAPALWPRFREALSRATETAPYGDPSDAQVLAGPVINRGAAERIEAELAKARQGIEWVRSTLRVGTDASEGRVIAPALALMPDREPDARGLVQEEIFGPVMTARRLESLPALIRQINSGRYGLQAGVFTRDLTSIETLYRDLEVGGLIVNDVPTTRYDHQPYGGVKESGQGREGVRYAMEEMTEAKFLALSSSIPGAPVHDL